MVRSSDRPLINWSEGSEEKIGWCGVDVKVSTAEQTFRLSIKLTRDTYSLSIQNKTCKTHVDKILTATPSFQKLDRGAIPVGQNFKSPELESFQIRISTPFHCFEEEDISTF